MTTIWFFMNLMFVEKVILEIYNFMVDNVKESFKWCGGVCLYRNKEFMKDWYELFLKQESGEWIPNI